MKKNILTSFFIMIFSFIGNVMAIDKVEITVNQFVSHVALDAAYNGFIKGLEDRKILPAKAQIQFANAQGSIATSVQIAQKQASQKPGFMVAIATPAAQTLLKAKKEGSILAFVAVTDPVGAGLVADDVIGVTDRPPLDEMVNTVLEIMPNIKTVGVLFNNGEINSTLTVDKFSEILKKKGIGLKKVPINSSAEIKSAFGSLASKVEVVFVPQDNLIVSALNTMVRQSNQYKIPLISCDPTLVNDGVMIAVGADYYKSGYQLAGMIADMINGKKLDNKIQTTNIIRTEVNEEVAEKFGIEIPMKFRQKEKKK